jgi:hypothetical protein
VGQAQLLWGKQLSEVQQYVSERKGDVNTDVTVEIAGVHFQNTKRQSNCL